MYEIKGVDKKYLEEINKLKENQKNSNKKSLLWKLFYLVPLTIIFFPIAIPFWIQWFREWKDSSSVSSHLIKDYDVQNSISQDYTFDNPFDPASPLYYIIGHGSDDSDWDDWQTYYDDSTTDSTHIWNDDWHSSIDDSTSS